ncbi:MAG: DUF423 domain-containing protein [Psychromonas sp.]
MVIASLLGATGVALGAYASHGLASWATIKQTEYFQLAVTYQLFHALALLAVSTLTIIFDNVFLTVSKIAFVLGIVFFSGSLYLYVFTGTKILGAITPIGGLLLIIAWLSLAIAVIRKQ